MNRKILCVDDSEAILTLFKHTLGTMGHTVSAPSTPAADSLGFWHPLYPDALVVLILIAGQDKMPVDSLGADEPLDQRCRELDVLPGGTVHDNVARQPAIIVQILCWRQMKLKFVAVH